MLLRTWIGMFRVGRSWTFVCSFLALDEVPIIKVVTLPLIKQMALLD
jgi:hypothetical protein